MAPIAIMMLPMVIPHRRPKVSAASGANGVEQIVPFGFPKQSSQYDTVWREFIIEPSYPLVA